MEEIKINLDLSDLRSHVRDKALQIANDLITKERYNKEEAIKKGIEKAQEWHFNSQG